MADRDRYNPQRPAHGTPPVEAPAVDPRIAAEYRRRRSLYLVTTFTVVAVVMAIVMSPLVNGPHAPILVIGLVLVTVGITLTTWRCPACGRLLGKEWQQKYCSYCGVRLTE